MTSRGLSIAARVLLCASALVFGAAVAHATHPGAGRERALGVQVQRAADAEGLVPPPPIEELLAVTASSPPSIALEADIRPSTPEPAPSEPDPLGRSLRDGMVITGATPHRLILFTFDDGPDHRYTGRLLDTLDDLGIRGVFFLTARRFEGPTPRERQLASIAREIARRGHLVGNHTMDHAQLPLLDAPALEAQVIGAERIFERVLGERPWLIRPPGGARSERVDAWLASRGYTQVLWNLGTGDFQVRTSDDVLRTFQRVLERRERENGERGGIVLLHDIHEWSVEALPRIAGWLDERNCSLMARGEELYDVLDDPRAFFAARGSASPSDEAAPAMPDPTWLEERQEIVRARVAARCAHLAMR